MGGSVHYRIFTERDMTVRAALRISGQIAFALAYLHAKMCQHRDVKANNIMLVTKSLVDPIAKLGDFGTSRFYSDGSQSPGASVGTPGYLAPEVFQKEYGLAADVFAYGLFFYEILAHKRAWDTEALRKFLCADAVDNDMDMLQFTHLLCRVNELAWLPDTSVLDPIVSGATALADSCLSDEKSRLSVIEVAKRVSGLCL
jgi:serine/threonine protein kinase